MNKDLQEEFEKIAELQARLNDYMEAVAPQKESLLFSAEWVKKNILQINDYEG